MEEKIKIKTAAEMQLFAAKVAKEVVSLPPSKTAKVISLVGDLGAGKTTFSQGFLKELGVTRRIISPTFLIVRPYKLSTDYSLLSTVYHIDCYRLNRPEELLALGFEEIIEDPKNIVLIEWPEIMEGHLPKVTIGIRIEHPKTGSARIVSIKR
jgi:tRNA threonylcarbamoyladenosine biosynthesis protein TsaE